MNRAGISSSTNTVLPESIVTAIDKTNFLNSIPLWAVTLIGGLFITVLSFIMIMTVYGRFFKLYAQLNLSIITRGTMNLKRLLSVLVAALMIAFILAGCGGEGGKSSLGHL